MKSDGTKETWDDTVRRVVRGNLSLVPEHRTLPGEEDELYDLIYSFRAVPAGRHLWMSGVEGRQFLFNCYVSGWGDRFSDHFAFTFNQLMEGGGVGANYSIKYLERYKIRTLTRVHIVCSDEHDNYHDLAKAGLLSREYDSAWDGALEVEDSREGWTEALRWVIDRSEDEYLGSIDLVLDVSNIRSAGKRIKTFGGTSAGPVPFAKMIKDIGHLLNEAWEFGVNSSLAMEMDHVISTCVVSGNVRRSARMSQKHWSDQDIFWFIRCKEDGLSHWSTNISVEIDNDFVKCLDNYRAGVRDSDSEHAVNVFNAVVDGMMRNGEPGLWNSSRSNVGEPNPVIATNPCGEICLEPWENCNLGHVNLDAFVNPDGTVDESGLVRAHELMARFLIRATFGDITDPKTADIVLRNRRIGLGHFGYAGFVAKQQIKYSESWKHPYIQFLLKSLSDVVQKEAILYSHELRIPVPVKTTTVAPTGTIAKMPGRTEGVHPIYARYFIRRIRYSSVDPDQARQLEEYVRLGYRVLEDPNAPNTMIVEIPTKEALVQELEDLGIDPEILEDASEISLEDMLGVQDLYQTLWADNAVSFTVNFKPSEYSHNRIAEALYRHIGSLKGTTLFPERGFVLPPYERISKNTYESMKGKTKDILDASYDEACASGACPVK